MTLLYTLLYVLHHLAAAAAVLHHPAAAATVWYYLAAAAAVLHYLAAAAVVDLVLVVAQVVGVPWCVEHQGQQKTKQLPRVEELQFRTFSDQKGTSLSNRTQSANKLKLFN